MTRAERGRGDTGGRGTSRVARRPAARLRVAVAAALVLAGGAAGCGVSTPGPVQQGLDVGSPLLPPVRFDFEAPPRGATPEQIVRGFLAASWSMDDDFRAARAYLTPAASKAWDPRSSVTVYPDSASLQVLPADTGTVTLRTRQDAALDASGRYRSLPAGTTRESVLRLSLASGEWRISSVPADFGLWISRFYFDRAYRLFSIAYSAPTWRTLVVDRRWLPVGSGLTTSLARALLETPPAYLRPAVRSGFPPGVRLAVDAVPVEFGQATIDLDPGVLDVTTDERRAAWAQALVTMRQVPEVDSVALQVAGAPLDVVAEATGGALPTTLDELGYGPSTPTVTAVMWRTTAGASLVDADDLGRNDDPRRPQRPVPEIPTTWRSVAAAPDLSDYAALSPTLDGMQRWRGGSTSATAGLGVDLTPPAYDRHGFLWLGGSALDGGSRIWSVDTPAGLGASPHTVAAPWLDAQGREDLLFVRPAPDGQRVLVVSRRAGGLFLGISGIRRDASGMPVELTTPWRIGGDVREVSSAGWVSNTSIAVIGTRTGGEAPVPLLVAVGGATTPLAPVPKPVRVVPTGGERGVLVLSGDGSVYGRVGGGWQQLGKATDVVVPGY